MKKIFTKILYTISLLTVQNIQAQTLSWAKQIGGTTSDNGYAITVDAAGNIYNTGYFTGTIVFNSGQTAITLTSAGTNNAYISKSDAAGNTLWAKQFTSTAGSSSVARGIAVDAAGNVYTTGSFSGTVNFGSGTSTFISAGNKDIFISKLDFSGNLIWAKQLGGADYDVGYSIAADNKGSVYITGCWTNNSGNNDIFISKLKDDGEPAWDTKKIVGNSAFGEGSGIAVDAAGNIYITGNFTGTVDFNPGAATDNLISASPGSLNIFITKLNADGDYLWAKKMGGLGFDEVNAIAVDANGIYTTGSFEYDGNFNTVDFNPDPNESYILNTDGPGDAIFISKLNLDGSFAWAKKMGGLGFDTGLSIALDTHGDVYTTGGLTSIDSGYDIFISKLNKDGDYIWAKQIGNTAEDVGTSIAVANGNVYTTGRFQGNVDFGAGTSLISAGNEDIFIAKYTDPTYTLPIELVNFTPTQKDGEVLLSWTTAAELNNDYFEIEKSTDPKTWEIVAKVKGAGTSHEQNKYEAWDKSEQSGTIYYRLKQVDLNGTEHIYPPVAITIKDLSASGITVYPNPFTQSFRVNSNSVKEFSVLDSKGRTIQNYLLKNGSVVVDLSAFANGVYFIKTDTEVKKVIKN
jgi:Secretion system C-terminal sorting domain/Beta-propeller repeat